MLAIRDQENVIHGHQTAAAAKPLNQGVRGLAPKTPGNNGAKNVNGKFPIRGKDDENAKFLGKKGDGDKHTFVTPLAPRDRAPLGAKTTNTKAHAFQTPAALTGPAKSQRRSTGTRRPKLKIHQPVALDAQPLTKDIDEEEEPDIEYCPPKITELPDHPDGPYEWGPDKKFPQFEGENMFRGWYSHFANPIDEHGVSKWEREDKEADERYLKLEEEVIQRGVDEAFNYPEPVLESVEREDTVFAKKNMKPKSTIVTPQNGLSTLTSASAAAALSSPSMKSKPNFAAPTAATRAKESAILPAAMISARRNTPGSAASRTTIGYSQGRKVSSSLNPTRSKDANLTRAQKQDASEPAEDTPLDRLLRCDYAHDEDEDVDMIFGSSGRRDWFQEEMEKEFVLELPSL